MPITPFTEESSQAGKPETSQRKKSYSPTSWLSLVLRGGVILSAGLITLGLLLFLFTGKSGYALDATSSASASSQSYFAFTTQQQDTGLYFPDSPLAIWQGVLAFKPFALIMLGLLTLIVTPILNVCLALVSFLQHRDRAFSLISLFVLALLAFSFCIG